MTQILSCSSNVDDRGANPLLESWDDSPYGIAPFERIKAEHYLEAFDLAFEEQRANIEYIVEDSSEVSFESVIWRFDNASTRLMDLKDLFEMSEAAIADESYHDVSEQIMPRISAANDSVLMNDALFAKIREVYDRREEFGLEGAELRLLERTYTRFMRGGALLSSEQKRELADINAEIALLTAKFSRNLLAENDGFYLDLGSKDLGGLPQWLRHIAKAEAKEKGVDSRWVFTLNPASMIPFLTYSESRELREEIYKEYLRRGSNEGEYDNREIVRRITQLRQSRAKLLGYENHADYVISQQMAGSVDAAYGLLDELWEPALKKATSEAKDIRRLLEKDIPEATLETWDWWYYAEKIRSSRHKLSNETIREYFSLEAVIGGAFALANRLYGIVFRPTDAPIYDPDCVVYEVIDRDNAHLGVLYFDLHPRSGKWHGAWCGNLREQRVDGGDKITPVVAVVCNFPRPAVNAKSLLTMEQVETLFHEFGHALHFLFQDVDYRGLSGVEGDFVEFPSQLMENWALEREFLPMYAVHHQTGAPIPDRLIESIQNRSAFNQGYETLSMVAAALLDLDLQTTIDLEGFDVEAFEREALIERRGLISAIEPRYHLPYFSHLFTYEYSAGYYFYLWSEVLDKDCFATFKSSGDLFSRELATKLRREVLERGGEADGTTLYRNFRGEEPSREPMLKGRGLID